MIRAKVSRAYIAYSLCQATRGQADPLAGPGKRAMAHFENGHLRHLAKSATIFRLSQQFCHGNGAGHARSDVSLCLLSQGGGSAGQAVHAWILPTRGAALSRWSPVQDRDSAVVELRA